LLEAAKFVKDFSTEIGGTLKKLAAAFGQISNSAGRRKLNDRKGQSIGGRVRILFPPVCLHTRINLRNDSGPVLIRGKFTACAYHVNNLADFFLAIAGAMREFSLRSRQIEKIPIVSWIWNVSC
jgi:hypothetical protein